MCWPFWAHLKNAHYLWWVGLPPPGVGASWPPVPPEKSQPDQPLQLTHLWKPPSQERAEQDHLYVISTKCRWLISQPTFLIWRLSNCLTLDWHWQSRQNVVIALILLTDPLASNLADHHADCWRSCWETVQTVVNCYPGQKSVWFACFLYFPWLSFHMMRSCIGHTRPEYTPKWNPNENRVISENSSAGDDCHHFQNNTHKTHQCLCLNPAAALPWQW